jgi:hypothetical protein
MRRVAAGVAVAILGLATLAGCGSSAYCSAIEEHEETLNTLGQDRTNTAYRKYARAYRAVGSVAPEGIRKDWLKLADVTEGVLRAQAKAGIKLEEMLVEDKLKKLSTEDLKTLRDAYASFNNTGDERKAVVKNAKQECEISLS